MSRASRPWEQWATATQPRGDAVREAAVGAKGILGPMKAEGRPIPPPNPTSYTTVGSANLDFTSIANATTGAIPFDAGKLTYTFTGGPTTVRNIQRFKP